MNQELFNHMQKQMTPSPEIREALMEKLAHPAKKRPSAWKEYAAVAACAVLVIGGLSAYSIYQNHGVWFYNIHYCQRDPIEQPERPIHSYVTVDGPVVSIPENDIATDTGTGGEDISAIEVLTGPNTGDLPGGAHAGDAAAQEEALNAYEKLMDRFNGAYPEWYGGAYIDRSGWLVVQLVESKDPADKSLELQVLDWTDSDQVMFSSCKYSLAGLNRLMDQLNVFPEAYPECARVMAVWGIDEERNRIELILTEADEVVLSLLSGIDPDDDAIYVQVGQRASTDNAKTEDPAVHHVMPGGVPAPDDEDLIAEEPYYDGAHYDVEKLPENLPQEKLPATTVDSASEEDASTSSWFPQD